MRLQVCWAMYVPGQDTVNAQAVMVYTETRPLQEVNTLINTSLPDLATWQN